MKLFIDCEFNSYKGQLLSMALVYNDGESEKSFYGELEIHETLDPWVKENVCLDWSESVKWTYEQFQEQLYQFLWRFEDIHLIADWPDDITYFTTALIKGPGERINTPPLILEIRRDLDAESMKPHHALYDALAIRKKYLDVTTRIGSAYQNRHKGLLYEYGALPIG